MSLRFVRRLASWIALVALLAVTFMPTISSALSARGDRLDICSADLSPKSPPSNGHHVFEHCPYCGLHTDLALLPLPPSAAGDVPVRFCESPAAFLQAPRATGIWSTSQPRAPPVFA